MNPSLRRNACPSLAAPMQTGDGLLVRINTLSGAIPPRHLGLIAEAAARHGNGILEVTRRGSLQVRGLTAESAGLFSNEVLESGIDVRSGVPVETGPLAGLDPTEIDDSRKIGEQLIVRIGESDLADRLGPKVSVVLDGGGQVSMGDILGDVRLTAVRGETRTTWQVAVGGTTQTARVVGLTGNEGAVEIAFELLCAIAARGRTGRGKDLSEQEISKACENSRERGLGGKVAISPSASRAEIDRNFAIPPRPASTTPPVGPFPLTHGRVAFGLGLPFGQATASQLSLLSQTSEESGILEFRLAPGHALLTICGTAAKARALEQAAARLGFIVDPQDPRLRIVACAGAPACSSGLIQTKEIAAEIAAGGMLPESGVVHVSGCAKGCAEPSSPAFTILATPGGAGIIEGKNGVQLARVAEREVAAAFQRVMASRGMGPDNESASTVRHRKSA